MSRRKARKNYLKHIRYWNHYLFPEAKYLVTPCTIKAHNKWCDAENRSISRRMNAI